MNFQVLLEENEIILILSGKKVPKKFEEIIESLAASLDDLAFYNFIIISEMAPLTAMEAFKFCNILNHYTKAEKTSTLWFECKLSPARVDDFISEIFSCTIKNYGRILSGSFVYSLAKSFQNRESASPQK